MVSDLVTIRLREKGQPDLTTVLAPFMFRSNGWKDIPKPNPTPPGDGEDLYSVNFHNWLLRCPPCFVATIRRNGLDYQVAVNSAPLGIRYKPS